MPWTISCQSHTDLTNRKSGTKVVSTCGQFSFFLEVMENRVTSYIFPGDHTGSQKNHDVFIGESKILDVQSTKTDLIIKQTEKVCAVAKARKDAVLKRLRLAVQHDALPSPQPAAFPRRTPKSSLPGRRLSPLSRVSRLNMEDSKRNQKSPESLEDDNSHTPRELRDIPLIENPTFKPTPPLPRVCPPFRRRPSRLPVLSAKLRAADKDVADGFRLLADKNKLKAHVERLKCFQPDFLPSPQHPAATRKTPAVMPLPSTPPTVPQPKRRGSQPRRIQHPAKAVTGADKMTASDCSLKTANDKEVAELQPLNNPAKSLSLFFKLLSSDNWMMKMDGLKTMQTLAQHHSETLKTKLHEVCLTVTEEVNNLCSAVACAAMNTLAELYIHLQKAMDPEVDGTGRALLLKLAQTTNAFIHQQANMALDAMVQNCSYGRILTALLNTGLSHRCVAVRGSMAQHLHMVADSFGVSHVLTAAGRTSTERLLTAVSKMCVDAAPEVRHHGQAILHDLSLHKHFLNLWTKIVPDKERKMLDKILRKTK